MPSTGSTRSTRLGSLILAVALTAALTACDEPPLTGSPVCTKGAARVIVFQGPDGECIPRTGVVEYRCDGEAPYTVKLGAVTLDDHADLNLWYAKPPKVLDV